MSHLGKAVFISGSDLLRHYFGWINRCSRKPSSQPMSIKYKKLRSLLLKVNKSLNIDLIEFGKDNIPSEGVYVLTPNHLSAFDPLAIVASLEQPTTFVSKIEVKKIPFVGKIVSAIEGLFLDRGNLKQSLDVVSRVQNDLVIGNKNWIIFPEGTRNKNPETDPIQFHAGSYRIAMNNNVPIVPVALFGTFRALKNTYKLKKYPVIISYLKPIYPSEYSGMSANEVAVMVRDRIIKELNENIKPLDAAKILEYTKNKKK